MKKNYKWIALSCTSLGAFFSVLSGSTLIVALPSIMQSLNAPLSTIMWMFIGYMLAITILVPCIGAIADIYGRKKLYVSGFFIFTIASLFCGLSSSGRELLIYRMIQAIGGALLIANSTAIVTDAFEKEELGRALGINTMVIGIASVIGPILGGLLTDISWRNIFFINVLVGSIGTLWAFFQLEDIYVSNKKQKFDLIGTIIFSLALVTFLIGFSFGGFVGWLNPYIIVSISISIILFYFFIKIENKAIFPMLDMKIIKNKLLGFAFLANLLNGIARGAITFLLIFYFHIIKGMDTISAGIMLTPLAISMMISSPISGIISDKFGTRILSSLGLLVSAIGFIGLMNISVEMSLLELGSWMFIMGIGSGMFFSPNTSLIMSSVPQNKRGVAAGIRTMMNNGGMMLSITLSMAIISSYINLKMLEDLILNVKIDDTNNINISNFILGLKKVFSISFGLSLIGALLSFLKVKEPIWDSEKLKLEENETT